MLSVPEKSGGGKEPKFVSSRRRRGFRALEWIGQVTAVLTVAGSQRERRVGRERRLRLEAPIRRLRRSGTMQ